MLRKMTFGNKDKTKSTIQSLSQALSGNKEKTTINTGSINQPYSQQKEDDVAGGASNAARGVMKLGKALYDSKTADSAGSTGSGIFSSAANDYISGSGGGASSSGIFGSAADAYISGGGASAGGSAVGDAIGAEVGGSAAGGVGGSVPWGAIAKGAKLGYNGISGKSDEDYSDLEESIIYPIQGAATGSAFGPWGAVGGAAYGLGYSFKDDVGLEDNDWLTTIIFPIGMGDEHQGIMQI